MLLPFDPPLRSQRRKGVSNDCQMDWLTQNDGLNKTLRDLLFVLNEKFMQIKSEINLRLSNYEPSEIAIGTLIVTAILCRLIFLISIQEGKRPVIALMHLNKI